MRDDFPVTIYHNPACGTSRNTLAMIEAAGYRPTIVEYLKTGWTRQTLEAMAQETFAVLESGVIRPQTSLRLPLKQAAEAHVAIESRTTTGATVLLP